MCEYCNDKEKSIEVSRYWDIYLYRNSLEIGSNFESDNRISVDINYCPMCGKDLRKKEK